MSWNNGYNRKSFEKNQSKQAEQYHNFGMSENQISEMSHFDLSQFNSDRKYARRTQPLDDCMFENDTVDESDNTLLDQFLDKLSCSIDDSTEHSRYWWIEEISNPVLAKRVALLSTDDKEILTLLVFEGYTQKEIADSMNVGQSVISRKFSRIKKILRAMS